jgi:hypothetical protein
MPKERVSSVSIVLVSLLVATLVGLVFYTLVRDPYAPPRARAPGPGAVPLPDSPATSTTTGQGVPPPGDRASGTIPRSGPAVAPPPLRPARPIIEEAAPSASPRSSDQPPAENQPKP